jgi:hypothetical protein
LKAPGFWFQPLNLEEFNLLVSEFAFKCNLYGYNSVAATTTTAAAAAAAAAR